jgi:hypothetical protein
MQFISNSQSYLRIPSKPTPFKEQLKQNLNQFGLNPSNWIIDFHPPNYALITNTDEVEFQFIGKLNPTQTNWEYIKLFSL